jgi:protein TonB
MEVKKSRGADLENLRVQGFILGLIVVLATMFVALEWNSSDSGWAFFDTDDDLEAEMELSPLKRDKDEIPMMLPQEQKVEQPQSEQLNLVDDDVELTFEPEPVERPEELKDQKDATEEEKPEVVDMYNEPVDFRVVEDLPQFPGGASEFMKWLTKNLKYPASAQRRQVKGKVVAQFIVNVDGSVSDLELTEHLDAACDREVLRVLRMMPKWQAGIMNAKPCRTKVCIPIVFNL